MKNYKVLDLIQSDIKHSSKDYLIERLWKSLLDESSREKKPIFFVNAYTCYLSNRAEDYFSILSSGLCLIDGKPLASLIRSNRKAETFQVRGPDFFSTILEGFARAGKNQILFGSTDEVCGAIARKIKFKFDVDLPFICPPLLSQSQFDISAYIREIDRHKPEIIWVALGTPKQDFVSAQLAAESNGVAIAAVGAAFDFYAGTKKEAPTWLRRLSLEWLYRLGAEPKRLWKRYLIGNLGFLADALTWRLRSRGTQK